MSDVDEVSHPGIRIRVEVIPNKMSVTEAAKLIGVGRPALSNLLNGKAALTADMAARIEKAFGTTRECLLGMQAQYESFRAGRTPAPLSARAYVPPFLSIKANAIENWVSNNIVARSRLAVFLRTLVHSTGVELSSVDFPGNDDSERPGWDGLIDAREASAWVPKGRSGWEFGTNDDPKQKADGDYAKSVKATEASERATMTFVFVTPRRWSGKAVWIASKKAMKEWTDVRAFDSSDLEQWLEQSLAGQAWFADETNMPTHGVRALDKCWATWANAASPPLAPSLFRSAVDEAKRNVLSLLNNAPQRPIIVAADSTDEAVAFLAQCLGPQGGSELEAHRYRVLVFDKTGILPRLAEGTGGFIPIIHSRDVEAEFATYASRMHSFVVYPRNSVVIEPDVILEPVGYETFDTALKEMGLGRDDITKLTNESGRSLTVLRRRLATVEAVRMPQWTSKRQEPEKLIPFMLVGAWNATNSADITGLSLLCADRSADDLEKDCQRAIQFNDAPLWSIGHIRGVISKIDLLHAIAIYVTKQDLMRFFDVARLVLGEDDPSLDLAEDQRWAASLHGKKREFSNSFRNGVSETLVLLSVYGENLFKNRLGIDTATEAAGVVRDLLDDPLTTRKLEANDRDLPLYAEAAPSEFLSIIARDLETECPSTFGLLRPTGSGIFGSPSRTGLLWALEGLSWNPDTLPSAVLILARLAEIEINDNWVNKPEHSLKAIFRCWMPQTAAGVEDRVALMRTIFGKFPDVAWRICVAQFGGGPQTGDYSHKPKWRTDGYGFGEPYPNYGPVWAFVGEMIELALTRERYTVSMLGDLIDRLVDLREPDQARVWDMVRNWASTANDEEKLALREKIRVSTLSRRAALRAKREGKTPNWANAGKGIYETLEPERVMDRHAWLFKDSWVDEAAEDLEDLESTNYDERNKRIRNQRIKALQDIFGENGIEGLVELSARSRAQWMIGALLVEGVLNEEQQFDLVIAAFNQNNADDGALRATEWLINGIFGAIPDDTKRNAFVESCIASRGAKSAIEFLLLAPFGEATWSLVTSFGDDISTRYWQAVVPGWLSESPSATNIAAEMLMKAGRPRAAFSVVKDHPDVLPIQSLQNLLAAMPSDEDELHGNNQVDSYYIERAFKCIGASTELSLEQKAILEFTYIRVLSTEWDRRTDSGIPNLERYVESHPELMVQAIVWSYRRKDSAEDPTDFRVAPNQTKVMAERGHELIRALRRIPGSDDSGKIDAATLARWVSVVRDSSKQLSRLEIADQVIGQLFASAPSDPDGSWPCQPVREVMEEVRSADIMSGTHTGVYNSRGVHMRGNGGDQERELADKYRKWAQQVRASSPFVASELLMRLTKTYEREATSHDTDAKIGRRLR